MPGMTWYGVRHVVKSGDSYEERVTLWNADSIGDAITQAETEATSYASEIVSDGEVLDLFQAYRLPEHEYESAAKALDDESGVAAPSEDLSWRVRLGVVFPHP